MPKWPRISSLVPWWLEHSDVNPADGGELALSSDVRIDGMAQRLIAVPAKGQYGAVLGLLALRCERKEGELIPMTLSIPDTPIVLPEKRGLDITLLSNPNRHRIDDDGVMR